MNKFNSILIFIIDNKPLRHSSTKCIFFLSINFLKFTLAIFSHVNVNLIHCLLCILTSSFSTEQIIILCNYQLPSFRNYNGSKSKPIVLSENAVDSTCPIIFLWLKSLDFGAKIWSGNFMGRSEVEFIRALKIKSNLNFMQVSVELWLLELKLWWAKHL